MNIVVIGLGSMGKRRIRLLKENYPDYKIVGVDSNEERCVAAQSEYEIATFASLKEAAQQVELDVAVISTSPLSHADIINECLTHNLNVFTELNLVADRYEENIQLAKEKNVTLFLSSTFLYRNEIKYLIDTIHNTTDQLNYSYHVGQYLPDWHPWESYKSFFVGNKRTNGCREIFAVELPWIIKGFGKIKSLHVIKNNISSLDLNYPDNFLVTIEHESGHKGQLLVDVVTRIPVRHLEVFGEHTQLEWRGKPEELYTANDDLTAMTKVEVQATVNRVTGYRDFVVEDVYAKELEVFFGVCCGKMEPVYDFNDDMYTLSIIDLIEE